LNIKESFISVFTNWKNFHGRACRSEYWYLYLSLLLIAFALTFLETALGIFNQEIGYGPFSGLFQIIVIIPSISVTSRRLQDRGISGWWQLSYFTIIGIPVILILLMLPAKEDENKWGRNPLLDL
jgi:uncharacterized membrane protein YhaH (DUF805 family)|tara:strand:+ start:81 stop:455 length:375 start_codon:yes stop_codon:yes gene_type:complete